MTSFGLKSRSWDLCKCYLEKYINHDQYATKYNFSGIIVYLNHNVMMHDNLSNEDSEGY